MSDVLKSLYDLEMENDISDDNDTRTGREHFTKETRDPLGPDNLLRSVLVALQMFLNGLEGEMKSDVREAGIHKGSPQVGPYMIQNCVSNKVKELLRILKSRKYVCIYSINSLI